MKNIILASTALLSSVTFARSPVYMNEEQLLVKEFVQRTDLMPGGGVRPVYTDIKVEVISGGCTKAADFKVTVNNTRASQNVTIYRINPDPCDMVAKPITIELSTEELALSRRSPIRVMNPVLVDEKVTY